MRGFDRFLQNTPITKEAQKLKFITDVTNRLSNISKKCMARRKNCLVLRWKSTNEINT